MGASEVDWSLVGLVVMGATALGFAACAWRRQWSLAALVVGLIHLPVAFVNAAAPFRGALDPDYVGYSLGLVTAAPGIEVAIFASAALLGAIACACIAVLNRPGARNYVIVAYDATLLLLLAPKMLSGVASRGLDSFRVEFGEYLQLSGASALGFEASVLLLPPIAGLVWGLGRASAAEDGARRNHPLPQRAVWG